MTALGHIAALYRYPIKSMLGEQLHDVCLSSRGLAGDRAFAVVDSLDGRIATGKHPRKWGQLVNLAAAFVDEPENGAVPPVVITFPDASSVRSDDPGVDAKLSRFLGREVTLLQGAREGQKLEEVWPRIQGLAPLDTIEALSGGRYEDGDPVSDIPVSTMAPAGTFFDLTTLHLLTTATLQRLSALEPEGDFDVRRYRPNLLIEPVDQGGAALPGFPENDWVGLTLGLGDGPQARVDMPTMRCVMTTLGRDGLAPDRLALQAVARHNRIEIAGMGRWACAGIYATCTADGRLAVGDAVTSVVNARPEVHA
jgi:uncharacterized protein YcbX